MNAPTISIITPSFNQSQFLEQTILSVLNQNYPNLEYIIIDGGSTDNSVDIIRKYEKHLSYWISEPDKGQSDAINKGLKIARGKIINWLNSDDYYEPNSLNTVAKLFVENPKINIVSGKSRIFKKRDETVGFTKGVDVYLDNLEKTIGWARIDQPETFFRRNVIEKTGLLDVELKYLMDRDLWIKYLLLYGITGVMKIPSVLVNFRLHDQSKTVSQKQHFQIEHDSWFYSIAMQYGLNDIAELIKGNLQINTGYSVKNIALINEQLVKRALNYFVLYRANTFYASNDKKNTAKFLNSIGIDLLKPEDVRLWRKLYFRNKFVPLSIINLLRK